MPKNIKKLLFIACLLFAVLAVGHFALAADLDVGLDKAAGTGLSVEDPRIVVANVIRIILGFLGIIAVGLIIYAGWLWMTAAGNEDNIERAKKILINAVIGLVIILSAFAIASFILSRLIGATGGDDFDGPGGGTVPGGGTSGSTAVRGTSPYDGDDGLPQNTAALFFFTRPIEVKPSAPLNYNSLIEPFGPTDADSVFKSQKFSWVNQAKAQVVQPTPTPSPSPANTAALNSNFKLEKIANINPLDSSEIPLPAPGTPIEITGVRSLDQGRIIYKFLSDISCADSERTPNCLPKWSKFRATINGQSGIFALGGRRYECAVGNICRFEFSTGEVIDKTDPQSGIAPAQMCRDDSVIPSPSPAAGAAVIGALKADANTVTGWGRDDWRIAFLKFSQRKISETVNQPPLGDPRGGLVQGTGQKFQLADYKYNTREMVVGAEYVFSVQTEDLAGHATSSSFSTKIKPGHCCNGIKDSGETDVDCGGECLACVGGPCNKADPNVCAAANPSNCSDNLCSTFFCECKAADGCRCGRKPIIFDVSPLGGFCSNDKNKYCRVNVDCGANGRCDLITPNGAVGNFVTISGRYFGPTPGQVYFTDSQRAALASSVNVQCVSSWQDNQIIAVVPGGAKPEGGPLKVVDSNNNFDTTNNDRGPKVNDFSLNGIKRPGLCLIQNNIAEAAHACYHKPCGFLNDSVNLQGNSFSSGGPDAVKFGNLTTSLAASGVSGGNNTSVNAIVPNIKEGNTSAFVEVSNVNSNFLSFTVKDDPSLNPVISYIDPSEGPIGEYITIYGRNFKNYIAQKSKVEFYLPNDQTNKILADMNFPEACRDNLWHDTYIVVKVPDVVRQALAPTPSPIPEEGKIYKVIVTNFYPRTSAPKDFKITAGAPGPGLCTLDPNNGPVGFPVDAYGQKFGFSQGSGSVKYYNNKPGGIRGWGDLKIGSNVANGAINGPVRVINGESKISNSLPFRVGKCSEPADCESQEECCGGGSYWSGICRKTGTCAEGPATGCGFSWSFTTSACAANQKPCGFSCCASGQSCDPAGNNGKGKCDSINCSNGVTCGNQCCPGINQCATGGVCPSAVESCSGYGDQCSDKYFCPNSPGKCSAKLGGAKVVTGSCVYNCNNFDACRGDKCAYDTTFNRCFKNVSNICSLPREFSYTVGSIKATTTVDCLPYNNEAKKIVEYRRIMTVKTSCPAEWISIGNNRCMLDRPQTPADKSQACPVCDAGFKCLEDTVIDPSPSPSPDPSAFYYGKCAIDQPICPDGSTCSNVAPNANKCVKTESSSCECCCRKDPTVVNQDCCAPLKCEGKCGSDSGLVDTNTYGVCTGCTVIIKNADGTTKQPDSQSASNNACNCSGTSGKFCDTAGAGGKGVCKDCAQLTAKDLCSNLGAGTCCVDNKNKDACRGGKAPYADDDKTFNYCAYYSCGTGNNNATQCQAPKKIGSYKTNNCDGKCAVSQFGSCSGYGGDQCSNSYFCPNSPGQCSSKPAGAKVVTGDCIYNCDGFGACQAGKCGYIDNLNKCIQTVGQTMCSLPRIHSYQVGNIKETAAVDCSLYNNEYRRVMTVKTSCPADWISIGNNKCILNRPGNQSQACPVCATGFECIQNTISPSPTPEPTPDLSALYYGICAVKKAVCPAGSICSNLGSNLNKCVKTESSSCECCCRKDPAVVNQDCCAPLKCEGKCGSDSGLVDTNTYGVCTGCTVENADPLIKQSESNKACNCSGTSGKFCDTSGAGGKGVCKDCAQLTTAQSCTNAGVGTCCVDAMKDNACRKGVAPPPAWPNQPSFVVVNQYNYCPYYKCNANNNGCNTTSPVASSTAAVYSDTTKCAAACVQAPQFGQTCLAVATSTGSCDINKCPGFDCINEYGNGPSASNCGTCCCDPSKKGRDSLSPATYDKCKNINPNLLCQADKGSCANNVKKCDTDKDGAIGSAETSVCLGDNSCAVGVRCILDNNLNGKRGLCCGCSKDNDCGNAVFTGCGSDTCCQARPRVINPIVPADTATNVCRNALIQATFNQAMEINTFAGNVIVASEYGSLCPAGTKYLSAVHKPTISVRIKSWLDNIPLLNKLLGLNFVEAQGESLLTPSPSAGNFCAVTGEVSGIVKTDADGAKTTVMEFKPQRVLEAGKQYYVIIKGDFDVSDAVNNGVLSQAGIGLLGTNVQSFNGVDFRGKIWSFTTKPSSSSDSGICQISSVSINPADYLFQTAAGEKIFKATASTTDGQMIAPIVDDYNWKWDWTIDNKLVAKFKNNSAAANSDQQTLVAESVEDDNTLLHAKATITHDRFNAVSTVGTVKEGVASIYVFLCANLWPPLKTINGNVTWSPWRDNGLKCSVAGGSCPPTATAGVTDCGTGGKCIKNCDAGGICPNTNFELHYCRDAGGPGTADDLPAILDNTIIRGSSVDEKILKEFFFFREDLPDAAGFGLKTVTENNNVKQGGKAGLTWSALPLPLPAGQTFDKYLVYYSTRSGSYAQSIGTTTVPNATNPQIIDKLTNGLRYYFAVTAKYKSGAESPYSEEVSFTPADKLAPAKPWNFYVAQSATSTAVISWAAKATSSAMINDNAVSYKIYYGAAAGAPGVVVNVAKNKCSSTVCSITIGNLNAGTTYYFSVTAIDGKLNESEKTDEKAVRISAQMKDLTREMRCQADLIRILTVIGQKRDQYRKTLGEITGVYNSGGHCWGDPPQYSADGCYNDTLKVFQKLGFTDIVRDPWNSFYIIEENEGELSYDKCGKGKDEIKSFKCLGQSLTIAEPAPSEPITIEVPFYSCK